MAFSVSATGLTGYGDRLVTYGWDFVANLRFVQVSVNGALSLITSQSSPFVKLEKHQPGSNTFVLTKGFQDGTVSTETVNYTYP